MGSITTLATALLPTCVTRKSGLRSLGMSPCPGRRSRTPIHEAGRITARQLFCSLPPRQLNHLVYRCGVILASSLALGMKPTMRSTGCPPLKTSRVGMLITPKFMAVWLLLSTSSLVI